MPAIVLKIIAQWRNRIEASFAEITEQMGLTRHGAHTFWGLLTRSAATIAAHTQLTAHAARDRVRPLSQWLARARLPKTPRLHNRWSPAQCPETSK